MSPGTVAIITPSYAQDRERCGLLCESLDAMARDPFEHYILVADHDVPLFKDLEGARRRLIPDSVLLPAWLKPMRRPFGKGRWIWVSGYPPVWPMSGWHVQQLRKILVARHIREDILVMADSDSIFIRPFDTSVFAQGDEVRLYRKPGGIVAQTPHDAWVANAAALFGLPQPSLQADDFIINLVTWRRNLVLDMIAAIEDRSGRDVVATLGRQRTFSEYQTYGAYVTAVRACEGHFISDLPLSHTYWSGDALTRESLLEFTASLSPAQIAVCVQSFTGTAPDVLRSYLHSVGKVL